MADDTRRRQPLWKPLAVEHGYYNPLMVGSIDGTDDRPHDRAISRAVYSQYRPNKQISGERKATIFVTGLNPSTKEEKLKEYFSKYGRIRNCRLIKDLVTGRSKRYCFIEYKDERDAERAYDRGHHAIVEDAQVIVEMELERTLPGWKPRRFGGGFGGKKESGQLRFGGRERTFRRPIVLGSHRHYDRRNEERRNEAQATTRHIKERGTF